MRRLQDAKGEGISGKVAELLRGVQQGFGEAMDDDLNVSVALAVLFDFVREMNVLLDDGVVSKNEADEVVAVLKRFDSVLGVVGEVEAEEALPKDAEELIAKREAARKAKDWATADALRVRLSELGVIVEDTAQGVRWHLVKKS